MPRKPPSLEISTMIYPTESGERVREALLLILPGDRAPKEDRITSHYGYSFRILTFKLRGAEAEESMSKVICGLPEYDFNVLLADIESRTSGRDLFIRLSKQELVLGRMRLHWGDPGGYVRLKYTLDVREPDEFREALRELRRRCTGM